jgi:hypothetical protein
LTLSIHPICAAVEYKFKNIIPGQIDLGVAIRCPAGEHNVQIGSSGAMDPLTDFQVDMSTIEEFRVLEIVDGNRIHNACSILNCF